MSAALVLLIMLGTAAIVWSACFVGCSFVVPYYEYESTVTSTPGLVALWPLNDVSGNVATCNNTDFNGTYTMGPVVTGSPGTFTLDQPNIVAGDSLSDDPTSLSPCVYFNGGFVSVPWAAALGPPLPSQFTLEAWVVPNWPSSDVQPKVVVSSSTGQAPLQGFALYATPNSTNTSLLWAAGIGLGTAEAVAATGNNQTIVQGSLYFLVVTYDGSTLALWVNPADTTQPPDGSVAASGYAPVSSPIPLYIGQGRPDLPTPQFPFNGSIQDVAFYNVVLDGQTIEKHYLNGSGMQGS
jgi:hypothetical protein